MDRKHEFDQERKDVDPVERQDEFDAEYDEEEFYDPQEQAEDEYDEEYDQYDDDEDEEDEQGGFFSTLLGKLFIGVIGLLMVAIIVLLVWHFTSGDGEPSQPTNTVQPLPEQTQSQSPEAVIFAPVIEATDEPTAEPTQIPVATDTPVVTLTATPTLTVTPAPTDTPEPTSTPLPIILSNTPTPSPTPTASPTPSPSPTPTPSPKPTATPTVELAQAETNREAKLRESASSSGKVKKTIKKGAELTIHETMLDKSDKVWYFVTVNDQEIQGWMRDYVVDVDGSITSPTPTPKPTAASTASSQTPAPEATEETIDGIGTGKTNRDANVRKIMNGKVLTQLRKGKQVVILDAKLDKNGDLWYEIQVKNSTTRGFVRNYVITLDKGVSIEKPTPTPKATAAPSEQTEKTESAVPDSLLNREVVGKAKTNRSANVRQKPVAGAKVIRQLSKGTDLLILDAYKDGKNLWYEVATESGKTHGFVRDYVIDISQINENLETKTYVDPTQAPTATSTPEPSDETEAA